MKEKKSERSTTYPEEGKKAQQRHDDLQAGWKEKKRKAGSLSEKREAIGLQKGGKAGDEKAFKDCKGKRKKDDNG